MHPTRRQAEKKLHTAAADNYYSREMGQNEPGWLLDRISKLTVADRGLDDHSPPRGEGAFFKGLSITARSHFELLANQFECPRDTVLISEEQRPSNVLFLLHGNVKMSMNSSDGKRFLLRIAGAGEILGIASAVSGNPSEIRAETMYPSTIASIERQHFLNFLTRYPVAFENIAFELSLHCTRAFERLRVFGLTGSAKSRLAGLLFEWCKDARRSKSGTQLLCFLTHQEIGECIGASRETITRLLGDLKNRGLLELHGTMLTIPSCIALARYAGLSSVPNPNQPAVSNKSFER